MAVLNAHWRGIKGGVICNTTLMLCFISSSSIQYRAAVSSHPAAGLAGTPERRLFTECVINRKVDTIIFCYDIMNRIGR